MLLESDGMGNACNVLGAWWGYAEADAAVVGVLVAAVVLFAAVYVIRRLRGRKVS